MKELKGTQTEKNLQAAFAGESQAYNKYGYYASVAKKKATKRSLQTSWKPPRRKRTCKDLVQGPSWRFHS